jgi:hypothetical protein
MATVNNHDVAGFARRINRFIDEIQHAGSGAGSYVSAADLTRANSYLDAVDTYHDHVLNQPQLDLPETHPRAIEIEEGPALVRLENESLTDLAYMLAITRDELVNSQSARLASGLMEFDSNRLRAVTSKARAFLADYVSTVTPLDLPESSPMRASTGPGRSGI